MISRIARLLVGALMATLALAAPSRAQVSGTTIVAGSTPIIGTCTSGFNLYNNSGVVGCQASSGSGTVTGATFTGGLISVTGSTTLAFTVAGTSGGIPYFSGASSWASSGALTAGEIVLGGGAGAAPTPFAFGTANQCLTTNAGATALAWASCGGSSTLTVNSTATSGGAAGQLMYDTGSVLTESAGLTTPGTGQLALAAGVITTSQPGLNITQTWNAGAVTFNALIVNITKSAQSSNSTLLNLEEGGINDFTFVGNNAGSGRFITFSTTGTIGTSGGGGNTIIGGASFAAANTWFGVNASAAEAASGMTLGFSSSTTPGSASDTVFSRLSAAVMHQGAADAAAPVAQTFGVQGVVTGTSNTAGANWTFLGSAGTGTGVGGDIIWKVSKAGTTGSAQNAQTEAFRIAAATALPQWPSSSTGAGTETFTNSPCTGLTTEQWIPVQVTGQTGTWFVPACQ